MSKAPLALIVLGALVTATPAVASSRNEKSATLGVSVSVVSSCGVQVQASGEVGVRCARGGADRVMVAASEPRVVMLDPDATRTRVADLQSAPEGTSSGERVVTLQF